MSKNNSTDTNIPTELAKAAVGFAAPLAVKALLAATGPVGWFILGAGLLGSAIASGSDDDD